MKSHIIETKRRGKPGFELVINHPPKGGVRKRERLWFKTRAEAESVEESTKFQYREHGVIWSRLKPYEQVDIMVCAAELRNLGTTIRGATEFYKANSGAAKHRTITLREMITITMQTKTTSNRRPRYLASLKSVLDRFARGRDSMPLHQVTPAMITDFLANQKGPGGKGQAQGSTLLGVIARLQAMFTLACKNNTYLEAGANPMNHVEMPYVDAKTPVILAPDQAEKLLWVCRVTDRQFLPYVVLGLFGGIRPEELEKLRWRDIHLDDGEIVIEDGVSKTRQRRCFEIEPLLMAWLKPIVEGAADTTAKYPYEYIFECEAKGDRLGRGEAVEKTMRTVRQCIRRHRKKLCKRAGIKWEQDILRKTCASFLMWKYDDNETKVAGMLGNSPKILHDHYRGIMRRKTGEQFEMLTPDKVRNTPIELPKGGQGKKAGVLIP